MNPSIDRYGAVRYENLDRIQVSISTDSRESNNLFTYAVQEARDTYASQGWFSSFIPTIRNHTDGK